MTLAPTMFRSFCAALVAMATATLAQTKPAAEDDRPVVDASTVKVDSAGNATLPTLFVVGDSTANSNAPMRGWGSEIGAFFDKSKINVVNRAIGGRSSRTYIHEGRWDKVVAELKAGDFVLIQFGHNDVGRYKEPQFKGRPSIHGDGDETAEAVKGDGKTTETIHTFGWYLRKYATDAKAKGATPILLSMIPHKDWKDGKIQRGERATFVKWTRGAAEKTGALFVDANEIIALGYERLGQEKVESHFADKRTHTSPEGAKYNAAAVVVGLKALKDNPLAPYFAKSADETPETLKPVE
jgi:lysophospholipase L1-like esterase